MRPLEGKTVFFFGKLAATNRKTATQWVARCGGTVVKQLDSSVQFIVIGEGETRGRNWTRWNAELDEVTREAFERGSLEIISETIFREQYGEQPDSSGNESAEPLSEKNLFTATMLAEISEVPLSVIRQLTRRGLLIPAAEYRNLSYFDHQNFLLLNIVRRLLEKGLTLQQIVTQLRRFKNRNTNNALRNVLAFEIEGKEILLATKWGCVDLRGQLRLSFSGDDDGEKNDAEFHSPSIIEKMFNTESQEPTLEYLLDLAWSLEADGDLHGALDLYRSAAVATDMPDAQMQFQIAELLYRLGELTAARERYFIAIEIDETFVEARARLGCVLAELGDDELATAAFRGALKYHPNYAEVHYHFGMLLFRNGMKQDAVSHLQEFLQLAPDSPWSAKAADVLTRIQTEP